MRLITTFRRRARGDAGFTLIELLVVLVILAVLLAIAVPSYLGFRARAADRTAQANLRSALPAAEAFYSDNDTYVGMDAPGVLQAIDTGISPTLVVVSANANDYCFAETIAGRTWSVHGPGTPAPGYFPNGTCT